MKSQITLTDEVNITTVEDLDEVAGRLNGLITKAANFAIDGEVELLRVELKTEPDEYRCGCRDEPFRNKHTDRCEQQKTPGRTYAQLVLKVSTSE